MVTHPAQGHGPAAGRGAGPDRPGPGPVRGGRAGPARPAAEATASGAAAATRTLPRDIASFTGRRQELAQLADAAAGAGGVVGIHAIGGMAGVGKTAFAVHAAHRLAGPVPRRADLPAAARAHAGAAAGRPGRRAGQPAADRGVPAAQIPPGLEARMALWRDRLAGRQLLLVLDDAASSEQVRPLLPGAGGSLVLVTSRRHLSALEDATAISLDTLPPGEAAALLVRLAGRPGLSPDDPAVAEITRLCGYLPLAIGMVARQLHHHPAWTAGRAGRRAGGGAGPAGADGHGEPVGRRRVRPVVRGPDRGSAAAVPPARAAPRHRHRRLRRRRPGRHRPGRRPPRPGGAV